MPPTHVPMPPTTLDPITSPLLALLLAFLIATATQLIRQLGKDTPPRPRRLLAHAAGAGLAGLATTGLLLEWLTLTLPLLVTVSSVVGWHGSRALDALGVAVEHRLGLRVGRPRRK